MLSTGHIPVLASELLELLDPKPNQNFLDCTLGGGGHARLVLEQTAPSGILYGIDRDGETLQNTKINMENYGERLQTFHSGFAQVAQVVPDSIWPTVQGAILDLGVSSFQLDHEGRGFSFQRSGPLDMRMDPSKGMTAKDFLSLTNETDLANVIFQLGGERNSRRIAKNIVAYRKSGKLNTTEDLAQAVMQAFPKRFYWKTHPATKTFQAIRMTVNDELGQIQTCLKILLDRLPVGARIAVITFHSLEDKTVKLIFREAKTNQRVRWINPKPVVPGAQEKDLNPRSRSAKLRVVERI